MRQRLGNAQVLELHDDSLDRHCSAHVYYVQSTKGQKVTLKPNNLHHFVSAAEIAVVIRLCLSKTRKSGKMQTSLRILLV